MEKKKSFFERRPYVCYALYAGLLFAFNLFLRWWSGELDADEYLMSAINTLISVSYTHLTLPAKLEV